MEQLLPLNGRIVIIDDQLNQAEPLIKILSQKKLPHTYYTGEVKYLPDEHALSDIRILFLDINLIDDSERAPKELKGRLVPVLRRVISEDNYPYLLIYWSRHERDKSLLEDDIFKNELTSRRPIAYISAMKSDYFTMGGEKTEDFEEKIENLFKIINKELKKFPAYSYLLSWENQTHKASNLTLQEIFGPYRKTDKWDNNADFIFNSLSSANLGIKRFEKAEPIDRIKGCFNTFNSIFFDTLESGINSLNISEPKCLDPDLSNIDTTLFNSNINYRINMADNVSDICEPGVVFEYNGIEKEGVFKKLLNSILDYLRLKELIQKDNKDVTAEVLKNKLKKEPRELRSNIRKSWIKIGLVVTPLCDYAQNKKIYDRIIKGLLIESIYLEWINEKSEAIYISPIFRYNDKDYVLVLDFRYFITSEIDNWTNNKLFRIRQQLLSEIQSKLARHINRQGVLYLSN